MKRETSDVPELTKAKRFAVDICIGSYASSLVREHGEDVSSSQLMKSSIYKHGCSRILISLIGTALFASLNAQVPGFGECPKVSVVNNFKLRNYLGLWYEVKKYPFVFTIGAKCVTAEYGLNPNGTASVFNR